MQDIETALKKIKTLEKKELINLLESLMYSNPDVFIEKYIIDYYNL